MQRVHLEYLGGSIELPPGETVVGRTVECAMRLNDPAVSRRHLRFIRRANELFVEDLGSSNGTLLNGRPIAAPLPIADGDTIAAGSRTLVVRVHDADNEDDPTTLVIKELPVGDPVVAAPRAATTPGAATVPPPFLRHSCPRCATTIADDGAACPSCGCEAHGDAALLDAPRPVDHRRHERQPVELHLVYSSSELEIEVVSTDISESGVFVCSQVLDPIGTTCTLTILVEGRPLRVQGVVRRVVDHPHPAQPIGLGVEFVGLGAIELAWIRAQLAPRPLL